MCPRRPKPQRRPTGARGQREGRRAGHPYRDRRRPGDRHGRVSARRARASAFRAPAQRHPTGTTSSPRVSSTERRTTRRVAREHTVPPSIASQHCPGAHDVRSWFARRTAVAWLGSFRPRAGRRRGVRFVATHGGEIPRRRESARDGRDSRRRTRPTSDYSNLGRLARTPSQAATAALRFHAAGASFALAA